MTTRTPHYVLENDVEIPPKRVTRPLSKSSRLTPTLLAMNLGQSFHVPTEDYGRSTVQSMVSYVYRQTGRKFTLREWGLGVRVWRTF